MLRSAPFLRYLLTRKHRKSEDAAAHQELQGGSEAFLPPGLELEWLGTSGFRIVYEGRALLIDPYLSRVPISKVISGRPLRGAADMAHAQRVLCDVTAILVGHTHFDHALDLAPIARATGARVYGSSSAEQLMRINGMADRAVAVEPYRTYQEGPFEITFVPSVHSKLVLGLAIPAGGALTCEHFDDLSANEYRSGDVFGIHIRVAGLTLYHQGSADCIDDAIRHKGIDIFLAGIAGRGFADRYLERVLPALTPRVIVPHHYDNFFRPFGEPIDFSFNVNLAGFVDEVRRISRDFTVKTLPIAIG